MNNIQNRSNRRFCCVLGIIKSKIRVNRIPTHIIVAGSAWVSRIIIVLVQIFSMRILLEGLGTQQFAAFVLLSGLMGWYLLADMGIGISLQNHISERRAKDQPYNDYMAVAAVIAAVLLVLTIGLLYYLSPYLAPLFLKNSKVMSDVEKTHNFFITGALFIGVSIGGVAYKVWYAEQKGYLSNIIPAIGSLIGLGGIFWANNYETPQMLFWSLIAFIAPTTLLAMLSLSLQVLNSYKNGGRVNLNILVQLMKRACCFWFFAIMATLVLQLDYVMLSQFVTDHDIAIYNIAAKVSMLPAFAYNAVLMALWPGLAEIITINGWQGVTRYIKKYLILGIVFMLISTLLIILFMPVIAKLLSPSTHIAVPASLILLFGVYQVIRVWTDTFSVVLQSKSDLRVFFVWTPVQAAFNIAFQLILAPKYGMYGVISGLILSYILTAFWVLPRRVYHHIKA